MARNNDLCNICQKKVSCHEPCDIYRTLYLTTDGKKLNLYEQAVKKFGVPSQILKAAEELTELAKELLKFAQYGADSRILDNIGEEMADVAIMMEQLKVIFGDNRIWEIKKLQHLEDKIREIS